MTYQTILKAPDYHDIPFLRWEINSGFFTTIEMIVCGKCSLSDQNFLISSLDREARSAGKGKFSVVWRSTFLMIPLAFFLIRSKLKLVMSSKGISSNMAGFLCLLSCKGSRISNKAKLFVL